MLEPRLTVIGYAIAASREDPRKSVHVLGDLAPLSAIVCALAALGA